MLAHSTGIEGQLVSGAPEVVDPLSVQLDSAELRLSDLVGKAGSCGLRDDNLGLDFGGVVLHEIEGIGSQRASLSIVDQIAS